MEVLIHSAITSTGKHRSDRESRFHFFDHGNHQNVHTNSILWQSRCRLPSRTTGETTKEKERERSRLKHSDNTTKSNENKTKNNERLKISPLNNHFSVLIISLESKINDSERKSKEMQTEQKPYSTLSLRYVREDQLVVYLYCIFDRAYQAGLRSVNEKGLAVSQESYVMISFLDDRLILFR